MLAATSPNQTATNFQTFSIKPKKIIEFSEYKATAQTIQTPTPASTHPYISAPLNILPADPSNFIEEQEDVAAFHSAEPVKSLDDIDLILRHMKSNGRYRDLLLFTIGTNTGLRCSDILSLRFSDVLNADRTIKDTLYITEKKTANTRGRKQNRVDLAALSDLSDEEKLQKIKEYEQLNTFKKTPPKPRIIPVNDAIKKALHLYVDNTPPHSMDEYLFRSESRNSKNSKSPLTRRSVQRMLETTINTELGLGIKAGTHLMRKTFGYQFWLLNEKNPRAILLLQQAFNHSSETITLRYIGFTEEEIQFTYKNLNIGIKEI